MFISQIYDNFLFQGVKLKRFLKIQHKNHTINGDFTVVMKNGYIFTELLILPKRSHIMIPEATAIFSECLVPY